ncbi:MAG: hypothetical protein HY470_00365 [Candidatus Ryanbacteria bacterium]|nr:hypothetical protein [Candidatus Ryanbacteria bacterium]
MSNKMPFKIVLIFNLLVAILFSVYIVYGVIGIVDYGLISLNIVLIFVLEVSGIWLTVIISTAYFYLLYRNNPKAGIGIWIARYLSSLALGIVLGYSLNLIFRPAIIKYIEYREHLKATERAEQILEERRNLYQISNFQENPIYQNGKVVAIDTSFDMSTSSSSHPVGVVISLRGPQFGPYGALDLSNKVPKWADKSFVISKQPITIKTRVTSIFNLVGFASQLKKPGIPQEGVMYARLSIFPGGLAPAIVELSGDPSADKNLSFAYNYGSESMTTIYYQENLKTRTYHWADFIISEN